MTQKGIRAVSFGSGVLESQGRQSGQKDSGWDTDSLPWALRPPLVPRTPTSISLSSWDSWFCPVPHSSAHSSWREWLGHWREAFRWTEVLCILTSKRPLALFPLGSQGSVCFLGSAHHQTCRKATSLSSWDTGGGLNAFPRCCPPGEGEGCRPAVFRVGEGPSEE